MPCLPSGPRALAGRGTRSGDDINIEDISQTIMQDYFTMIMMVSISANSDVTKLGEILTKTGEELGVIIRVQHEDIFNAMHKL